ncbi:hypothetical protein [Pelagibaculum spongiae]|uniref:Uncharacterized protein n=1 Tax=Pelagibaculum spongiae TaxID=2080658 RepID=A0A2V1GP83_9GAMM|nr:hypothetical protein [Pelagibaculum spongiae]PVZ64514.1 hypothetical protein DC094_19570 [Pelagibaculum spongiae]
MTSKTEYLKIRDLKRLFDAGALLSCNVHLGIMNKAYNVHFESTAGNINYWIAAHRDPSEMRQFKTLDAAGNAIKEIGFRKFSTNLF